MTVDLLVSEVDAAREQMAQGRARLVSALRVAKREGMSERQIAQSAGVSQAEVNRLVRFHGTSPNGRALRAALPQVRELLRESGLSNPRVFGSTARGADAAGSDIDLLVASAEPIGLFLQAELSEQLSALVGRPVDLVFENSLREDLAERILREAVPL